MSPKHIIEVPVATHNVSKSRVKKNKAVPASSQEGNNLLSTSANKGSSKAITAACVAMPPVVQLSLLLLMRMLVEGLQKIAWPLLQCVSTYSLFSCFSV